MVSLYAMAGIFGLLVVGTGNKVEDYGIGFFTKYGDGGVDVSPIGELYKTEVRELGRQMGILASLTEAIPTDGLHADGSTDEDQIGTTYDELEWAMPEYESGKRVEDFSGRARQVMEIYSARHTVNAHKMAMPPVFSIE